MRSIPSILAFCAIVIISSCSKKYSSTSDLALTDPVNTTPIVMNETISAGKTFTFTLGNGNASITKQALHFLLSEATANDNGELVYRYTPASNFSGTDEVEIVYSASGATGSGCSGTSSETSGSPAPMHYAIKFSVAN